MFANNDWESKAIALTPQDVNDKQHLKELELYKIQLIEEQTSYIYYTNIHDPCLPDAFKWVTGEVGDNETIAIDLEWRPDFREYRNKPCLFQIGTCSRVLIIRYVGRNCTDGEVLKNFLVNHKFIGKGIGNDLKKLNDRFNINFNNISDMERVYLRPNNLPLGFATMCDALGVKATASYKNKKVSRSKWEANDLSKQQVLYSAFDVVGLYYSFKAAKERYPETNTNSANVKKEDAPKKESVPKKVKTPNDESIPKVESAPKTEERRRRRPRKNHPVSASPKLDA